MIILHLGDLFWVSLICNLVLTADKINEATHTHTQLIKVFDQTNVPWMIAFFGKASSPPFLGKTCEKRDGKIIAFDFFS